MIGDIWFGDHASYVNYVNNLKLTKDPAWVNSMYSHYETQRTQIEEVEFENRLLSRVGNTAILSVNGDLVANKSWYDRFMGWVSYEEIVEALEEVAGHDDIERVVANYSTGGGTANGLQAAADYIKYFDTSIKPIYSHTDSASFSAGYWLYSAARKTSVSEMGQLGSIGALNIHVSYKDMLDEQGIVYTVFREGEFKALGQPFEKLGDKEKAYFQERLSKANSFFLDAVVRNRKISMSNQAEWGEGKTHYGRESVALGLADEMTTLTGLLGRFTQAKSGNGQLRYGGNMPKAQLNGDSQDVKPVTADEVVAGLTPELLNGLTEIQLAQVQSGVPLAEVLDQGLFITAQEVQTSETKPAEVELTENAELAELKETVADLTAKLQAQTELTESMKTIVLATADARVVGMGGRPVDMTFLDAANALKYFEQVDTKFKSCIKKGPVSQAPNLTKPAAETGAGLSAVPSAYERAFARTKQQDKQ